MGTVSAILSIQRHSAAFLSILAVLGPFISPSPAVGQTNLLVNGSFESGNFSGWVSGGATIISGDAHDGVSAARVTTGMMEADIGTSPGTLYKLTFWCKITSETGNDWGGLQASAVSWDWQSLGSTGPMLVATRGTSWFKGVVGFTASTAQTRIQIGYFGGAGRSMVALVDDVRLFVRPQSNTLPLITAAISPDALPLIPDSLTFEVTGDDSDGAIRRIEWDFGDGSRSLAPRGSHQVSVKGSFVATLKVTDDDGGMVEWEKPWTASSPGGISLSVSSPAQRVVTTADSLLLMAGTTTGSVSSVILSSDRGYVTEGTGGVAGLAEWNAQIVLSPGRNRVLVQAASSPGEVVTDERLVVYHPAGQLSVSGVLESGSTTQYDPVEITFDIENSWAGEPQFPYVATPAPGLGWVDGVTVDALFANDNWSTVFPRPAFLLQPCTISWKDNEEWVYPSGRARWCVRFSPPLPGSWSYRIEVTEARGKFVSTVRSFSIQPVSDSLNHGPIRVSPADSRYFEYADGAYFPGAGHGIGFGAESFSHDAETIFSAMGTGNQDFFRWWIAGQLWGSAWQPWNSRTLGYDGTVPATGLSLESAYGEGLASFKIDGGNPIMFQGFNSGHAGLVPGKKYLLAVRWRSENITGPSAAGKPFGACVKLTGWPEPGQTEAIPALIPHLHGSTPWHVATGTFTASGNLLPNIALIFENATGGAAWIDNISLREARDAGSPGPELLRSPAANSILTFDQHRGAQIDRVLGLAAARGMAFKLVISEKQEFLLNHFGADGLPDPNAGNFNGAPGSPVRQLHEAYWRHLFARFGASRAVHSWECVNEEAPGPGSHFDLVADLAQRAAADGNPHPASTSTWATLAEDAWKSPSGEAIPYTDFHAYVRGTGWIEPKDSLASDPARFFLQYDQAARSAGFGRPVVWGEMGIDGTGGTDGEDPGLSLDQQGVWLHSIIWARCGWGGVYPLYWYTGNIFSKSLHGLFGAWKRFMRQIPVNSGRYGNIHAGVSNPLLRVAGQVDTTRHHAFFWVDNAQHTWKAVTGGLPVLPQSGGIKVRMGIANADLPLVRYSTTDGLPMESSSIHTDAAGAALVEVTDLATDAAFQVGSPGAPTPVVPSGGNAPVNLGLEQNYPNPFNPTTNIRYQIPDIRYLKLAVYDLLGREVAVLVDGLMQAGEHSVRWDASGYPSGLFFCRVTAGTYSRTIKMILVK